MVRVKLTEKQKEKVMTKCSFLIGLATLSIWSTACKSSNNDSTDSGSPPVDDTGPASEVDVVYSASTFTVDMRPDEVYGQGQTHSGWNAPDPEEMDLKLYQINIHMTVRKQKIWKT